MLLRCVQTMRAKSRAESHAYSGAWAVREATATAVTTGQGADGADAPGGHEPGVDERPGERPQRYEHDEHPKRGGHALAAVELEPDGVDVAEEGGEPHGRVQ